MTKQEAIDSLTTARNEMEEDPGLECVDTIALMEQAIDDAYSYLMLDPDTSKPSAETVNAELLKALRNLLKMVEDGDYTTVELSEARAAIAQAEGK